MGRYSVHLVGESNYQKAVRQLVPREGVQLVPEPSNTYDPRAIKVTNLAGQTIGYIERGSWLTHALLDQSTAVRARVEAVIGGEKDKPSFGVVLDVLTANDASSGFGPDPQEKRYGCLGAFALILVAVAAIAPGALRAQNLRPADPAFVERSAAAYCAKLFPESFSTQQFCRGENIKGGEKYRALTAKYANNAAMMRALQHCYDLFEEGGIVNFDTAAFCAMKEEESYLAMTRG